MVYHLGTGRTPSRFTPCCNVLEGLIYELPKPPLPINPDPHPQENPAPAPTSPALMLRRLHGWGSARFHFRLSHFIKKAKGASLLLRRRQKQFLISCRMRGTTRRVPLSKSPLPLRGGASVPRGLATFPTPTHRNYLSIMELLRVRRLPPYLGVTEDGNNNG